MSDELRETWEFVRKYDEGAGEAPELIYRAYETLDPSCVYVVRAMDRVKIGRSSDPESRISSLQSASPFPLEPLAVWPEFLLSEADAHARWAAQRSHREWFDVSDELVAWAAGMNRRGQMARRIQLRTARLVERMREGPRRPLMALSAAEERMRADRLMRQQLAWEEAARAKGCLLCGEGEPESLQKNRHVPGFTCRSCGQWLHRAVSVGLGDMRRGYADSLAEAQERIRLHDWRVAQLHRVLSARPSWRWSGEPRQTAIGYDCPGAHPMTPVTHPQEDESR